MVSALLALVNNTLGGREDMERERGKDTEGIGEMEKRDFFTLWWTGRTAAKAKNV